jgi:hypothetical protein
VLQEEIRDYLASRHSDDPELKYLEAVSLTYFYNAAGKTPQTFAGTVDENIIEETKRVAVSGFLDIFNKFETIDFQLKEGLFNRWLSVLIDGGKIVSPELITKVLKTGNNFSQSTKSRITEAVGNKGAWIISHSSEWKYKPAPKQESLWAEGNQHDRKNLFIAVRLRDRQQAIALLQSTWASESIVNKRGFLEIIKEDSSNSDVPFLEELIENEFKYQPKEKKTERECRRTLVEILLRYQESKIFKATSSELTKYFSKAKKGILGFVGREQTVFVLPEAEDAFWNASTMEQTFGLESKNFDIAVFAHANQYWLSCFLHFVPFDFWINPFGDIKSALDHFLEGEKYQAKIAGKTVRIFVEAIVENAKTHGNKELAWNLVQRLDGVNTVQILAVLSEANYESFVKKNKFLGDVEILSNGPYSGDNSWSLSFSQQVIVHAYELSSQLAAPPSLGRVIAERSHKDSHSELLRLNDKAREQAFYDSWNKNIFLPVHAILEITNLIDSHKNQNP